ncbi:TetR/AcrR family transcriptional regulator [Rhodococcus erythropolis]|uniref:TetR/AcrR family transcriptional regulator n=1 Tax=Rhodococcus erythropolis TaxID=1833 RepID=UPI001E2AC0EE|nr:MULTISPECIES: TetR/AcrR family transcriptional regulator [Rhodococcus erythropolis group]MCD2106478.1 TetR/AcrR family transcriptional regulator [Rhodococcus qingshengii]MCZ4525643.1 TetR/AcrR family transcriptional regulator [Rhodococcus erythropolis]
MPRIDAPTVVEHRAAQRRALLDAAHALLSEAPDRPPGLGEVAAKAGLARSSVYHYFRSREDLLSAVVEDMFPRWNDKIVEAMAGADDPVWAYVEANLQLVADGEHAIVGALATLTPQTFRDSRIMEMHDSLVLPLVEALRLRGVSDPKLTAKLINSLVHTGTELIESGCGMEEVRSAVREILA